MLLLESKYAVLFLSIYKCLKMDYLLVLSEQTGARLAHVLYIYSA
jgi:hypothetical protein